MERHYDEYQLTIRYRIAFRALLLLQAVALLLPPSLYFFTASVRRGAYLSRRERHPLGAALFFLADGAVLAAVAALRLAAGEAIARAGQLTGAGALLPLPGRGPSLAAPAREGAGRRVTVLLRAFPNSSYKKRRAISGKIRKPPARFAGEISSFRRGARSRPGDARRPGRPGALPCRSGCGRSWSRSTCTRRRGQRPCPPPGS